VSQSWVNGRSSLRRFIPITLCQIKRSFGNQATIEYNGQLYKTSPIKINVTAAVEPKDPNDTSVSADNNISGCRYF
jgi:hypothetical protein